MRPSCLAVEHLLSAQEQSGLGQSGHSLCPCLPPFHVPWLAHCAGMATWSMFFAPRPLHDTLFADKQAWESFPCHPSFFLKAPSTVWPVCPRTGPRLSDDCEMPFPSLTDSPTCQRHRPGPCCRQLLVRLKLGTCVVETHLYMHATAGTQSDCWSSPCSVIAITVVARFGVSASAVNITDILVTSPPSARCHQRHCR